MEEDVLKDIREIVKLNQKIKSAIERSDKKQQRIDELKKQLRNETRPLIIEEGQQKLIELEADKREYDDMTIEDLAILRIDLSKVKPKIEQVQLEVAKRKANREEFRMSIMARKNVDEQTVNEIADRSNKNDDEILKKCVTQLKLIKELDTEINYSVIKIGNLDLFDKLVESKINPTLEEEPIIVEEPEPVEEEEPIVEEPEPVEEEEPIIEEPEPVEEEEPVVIEVPEPVEEEPKPLNPFVEARRIEKINRITISKDGIRARIKGDTKRFSRKDIRNEMKKNSDKSITEIALKLCGLKYEDLGSLTYDVRPSLNPLNWFRNNKFMEEVSNISENDKIRIIGKKYIEKYILRKETKEQFMNMLNKEITPRIEKAKEKVEPRRSRSKIDIVVFDEKPIETESSKKIIKNGGTILSGRLNGNKFYASRIPKEEMACINTKNTEYIIAVNDEELRYEKCSDNIRFVMTEKNNEFTACMQDVNDKEIITDIKTFYGYKDKYHVIMGNYRPIRQVEYVYLSYEDYKNGEKPLEINLDKDDRKNKFKSKCFTLMENGLYTDICDDENANEMSLQDIATISEENGILFELPETIVTALKKGCKEIIPSGIKQIYDKLLRKEKEKKVSKVPEKRAERTIDE